MIDPYLSTPRLDLVRPEPEHLALIEALFTDAELMRFIGGGAIARELIPGFLTWMRTHWEERNFGPAIAILKSQHRPAGLCGLKSIVVEGTSVIDLGFMLVKECHGQGLATEAARALVAHARDFHKFEKIVANADPENAVSIHILEKLGFTYVRPVSRAPNAGVIFKETWLYELIF